MCAKFLFSHLSPLRIVFLTWSVYSGVDGQLLEANGLVMREPKTILEEVRTHLY